MICVNCGRPLPGKICDYCGTVKKIGHITDDKWFDIDEFFKSKQR